MRRQELEASCDVLKVSDLEMLDYADSGMTGWPSNDAPGSFWQTPVQEGAARLAELMRHYRPDVVVTYDENGFYGHPDHIQAHRITMAALEMTALTPKVYWTTMPRSMISGSARSCASFMRTCRSRILPRRPRWPRSASPTMRSPRGWTPPRSAVRSSTRSACARQSGREHLLPQDGQGEVRRVDGHGDLRTCPGRHRRGHTRERSLRRTALIHSARPGKRVDRTARPSGSPTRRLVHASSAPVARVQALADGVHAPALPTRHCARPQTIWQPHRCETCGLLTRKVRDSPGRKPGGLSDQDRPPRKRHEAEAPTSDMP